MDLGDRGEIEPEAGIGSDQHLDLAAELPRQYRALHIAARECRDWRIRRAGLDLVQPDLALGILAEGWPIQPPTAFGKRRAVEFTERNVVGDAHAADAGVLQGFLGEQRHLVPAHLFAACVIEIAADADLAAFGLALAGQHFDKLPLAVAGDACNADDLAAAHGERYAVDGDGPGIVERGELAEFKPGFPDFANPWRLHHQLLGADHGTRHIVSRGIRDAAMAG